MASPDVRRYEDSGVNYNLMDPFKKACQLAAQSTKENMERFSHFGLDLRENPESRGESAYEIDFSNITRPNGLGFRLGFVIEGLGTKNEVEYQMRQLQVKIDIADELKKKFGVKRHKGIGIDNAAMNLNDLATRGSSPFGFALHVAAYPSGWFSEDLERNEELIDGTVEACNQARCTWGPGESPALRDIINPGHAVISGSCLGLAFPENGYLSEKLIEEGDRIILFESSGIHSNGLTLPRTELLPRMPKGFETQLSDGTFFGDALCEPTVLYSRLMDGLVLEGGAKVKYATHISGHGWRKVARAKAPYTYVFDKIPTPQSIFEIIQEVSGQNSEQMYGDYNMGAGFMVFADETEVAKILAVATRLGYRGLDAGYVDKGPKQVIIRPLNNLVLPPPDVR